MGNVCDCGDAMPSNKQTESKFATGLDADATKEYLMKSENWLDIVPDVKAAGAVIKNDTP